MSTPGRVELDEGISAAVGDNFFKVLTHGHNNVALSFGHCFRLYERFELSCLQLFQESLESFHAVMEKDEIELTNTYNHWSSVT